MTADEKHEMEILGYRETIRRLEWMLDEHIRHGHYYDKARAGYAAYFTLIKQDLAKAYAERDEA